MAREFTEKQAIRNLQKYLRQLSFFDESMSEPPIDGVYASDTREAVAQFQRNNALAVTGVADRETWDAIYQAYLTSLRATAKPVPIDIFYREPTPSFIRIGDAGFHVAAVQYMLNEIFVFYGTETDIATDGSYGEQTADAVRIFQQYSDLPQTGEVDKETWDRLAIFYNEHFRLSGQ